MLCTSPMTPPCKYQFLPIRCTACTDPVKPRAKYFLLRNEISFPQPVYYLFMVVDVIGRSVWFIYLIPGAASVTLKSFLAALVEMLRRACWNNLRSEKRHTSNRIPLDFHVLSMRCAQYREPRTKAQCDHPTLSTPWASTYRNPCFGRDGTV